MQSRMTKKMAYKFQEAVKKAGRKVGLPHNPTGKMFTAKPGSNMAAEEMVVANVHKNMIGYGMDTTFKVVPGQPQRTRRVLAQRPADDAPVGETPPSDKNK